MKIAAAASVFTLMFGFGALSASAGNVEYRILVNGQDVDEIDEGAGTYEIEIQVQVSDNDIPGAGPGGLTGFAFNVPLETGLDAVEASFLGNPTGSWDIDALPSPLVLAGALTGEEASNPQFELFDVSGGFIPSTTNFGDIGAGQFTTIMSGGQFEWDGTEGATLTLEPTGALVAVLNQAGTGIASVDATTIVGDSVVFGNVIPEPTSLALIGLGVAGVVSRRRRA